MRWLEDSVDRAVALFITALPVLIATVTLTVMVQIVYALRVPKPTKGKETMISIMMKPADARGKYTVLAGLSPSSRKTLCTIRAKNILAADKALLGILENALAGLDIDAGGPVDPPASNAPETPTAPAETGNAPADEPVADGAITDGSAAEDAP